MLPRILVVDDWEPNLLLVEKYLKGIEAEIITCIRSLDAKKMVEEEEYALFILDIQMPDLDGYGLAELIRSSKLNMHTPIMFLTGVYSDMASVFKGYRAGAVDYLTKPIKREVLLGKVIIFIQLYQQRCELKEKQLLLEEYIEKLKETEKSRIKLILEGEDREKMRIASELHDGIGQYLSAASMNFNSAKEELDFQNDKIRERFDNGLNFLNQAIIESRALTGNLVPKLVNDFGLVEGLEMLMKKLNETSKTNFKLIKKSFKGRLNKGVELHLYRMGQECFNNVIKHSEANTATMQIVIDSEQTIHLTCEDDGKGFEMNSKLQDINSYGLQSLYHRTKLLGGNISVESQIDKGTMVTIDIPLIKSGDHEEN
jgi:signal transduction histidine kinase